MTEGRARYSVTEAAQVLGVGTDAIRKRIQRDTIEHERIDGTVYVWLDSEETRRDNVHDGVHDAYINALKSQIELLQDQLHTLKVELSARNEELERRFEAHLEESRRKDHLLAAALERIPPALEEARETPSESPATASEPMEGVEVPLAEERPSWWRRFFGIQ